MVSSYRNKKTLFSLSIFLTFTLNACVVMQKNPEQIQWSIFDTLPPQNQHPSLGYAGPLTGIYKDLLFIGGGANFPEKMPWLGGKKKYYDQLFVKNIEQINSQFQEFNLPFSIAYSANCSTPQGIIAIGGENESGVSNRTILINWENNTPKFNDLPKLPIAVTNAAITYIKDEVFVIGGEDATQAYANLYKLNLKNTPSGWEKLTDLPHPVSNTIFLASDDGKNLYLFGGRKKNLGDTSTFYANVYQYQVLENKWIELAPMPYPLSAGTGSFINKHTVVLYGGDKGIIYHQTEKLINAINQEKDNHKKEELIASKTKLQSEHPGFSKTLLYFDIRSNTWTVGTNIPYVAPVTTTAIKNHNQIFIPSGEIRAGVRSPLILKGTLK